MSPRSLRAPLWRLCAPWLVGALALVCFAVAGSIEWQDMTEKGARMVGR